MKKSEYIIGLIILILCLAAGCVLLKTLLGGLWELMLYIIGAAG